MTKKIILITTVFLLIILLIYPYIKIFKNGKLYSFTYSSDMSKWETNMCFDDSFSYNEDLDITIYEWQLKKFLFFKVAILDYKKGNYCDIDNYFNKDYSMYSFVDKNWTREGCDIEILSLSKNGQFLYYFRNGNLIDDFDLYKYYEYDQDKNIITIISPDGIERKEIKIISYSDNELKIKIDGEERIFNLSEDNN